MFDPKIHRRRSIRLRRFDYSEAGMYFITICAYERLPLFGEIKDGKMQLNDVGRIAHDEWLNTAKMRPGVSVDDFVIMPNHMHGVITVGARCTRPGSRSPDSGRTGATKPGRVQRAPTVGDIVRGYKSAVTRRIRESNTFALKSVWQRNYYEHVIRDEASYLKIAEYIHTNPQRWAEDVYYV